MDNEPIIKIKWSHSNTGGPSFACFWFGEISGTAESPKSCQISVAIG